MTTRVALAALLGTDKSTLTKWLKDPGEAGAMPGTLTRAMAWLQALDAAGHHLRLTGDPRKGWDAVSAS